MKGRSRPCSSKKQVKKCEEDEKMKVTGDLDSKKKKDERKREIVKQLRQIDEFTDLPQELVGQRKENVAPRNA